MISELVQFKDPLKFLIVFFTYNERLEGLE